MAEDIVLTVDEGRTADAARFFTAGHLLMALLDTLSDTPDVDWQVTDLRLGCAVAAIEACGPSAHDGRRASSAAVGGLLLIQGGGEVPPGWSPDAVSRAQELVRAVDECTKLEHDGNVVWLDRRLRDALETQTPWTREFYGCVRGTLTGVNVTRGNRASVKPQDGGRVVHVGFPHSIAKQMRQGLYQFVQVDGMLRQNDQGRTYHVSADQVHLLDAQVPTWRELKGSVPDLTGGRTTNEYLESFYGEE